MCPLLRQANIAEELPDVPEHPCEENDRKETEWDQSSPRMCNQPKCTCQMRKGASCNKVFNQYLEPQPKPKYKSPYSIQQIQQNPPQYQTFSIPPAEKPSNFHFQLAGKVRGLRDVLTNLHDDFHKMNERYDILSAQLKIKDDPNILKELEAMEKELNSKEEEISVVISLYKEVLALKEQLKTLKEKTSVLSMSQSKTVSQSKNEPTVTLRLTKLLRQVQHFQGMLKQRN